MGFGETARKSIRLTAPTLNVEWELEGSGHDYIWEPISIRQLELLQECGKARVAVQVVQHRVQIRES